MNKTPDNSYMSDSKRNDQVVRILKVIMMLENHPQGMTIKEIGERFKGTDLDCSERTLFRDMKAIETAHFPISREKIEERSVWKFNAVAVISDKVKISYEELKALYISKEFLEPLRGTNFYKDIHSFYEKLEKLLGAKAMKELLDIGKSIQFKPKASWSTGVPQDVMDVLYAGCNERHKIWIEYQSTSGENAHKITRRLVGPETLYLADAGLYLIAKDLKDNKTKTFSVPRVKAAEWTDEEYISIDFNAKAFFEKSLGVLNMGQAEPVQLLIKEPLASYVAERKWHESQTVMRKGDGLQMKLNVKINDELVRWILSLGPSVVEIEPPKLRHQVGSMAEEIASIARRKAS